MCCRIVGREIARLKSELVVDGEGTVAGVREVVGNEN